MAVVIVDDSVTNLVVLKSLMASVRSSEIVTFSDSEKAAQYLATHGSDLIIVDYSMPKMNGIEFISTVRRQPHHAETPIVMVTQQSDREVRMRALDVGATDFLSKPVDPSEFKARARNLLKLHGVTLNKPAVSQAV
jgi:putative two-component system response regulator